MWGKIMRYYHLHQVNPDRYPEWRNTFEWSEFTNGLKEWMSAFFTDSDSVFNLIFLFFLNNPALVYLISFGCAFGAFSLLKRAFHISHTSF